VAEAQGLEFMVETSAALPDSLEIDPMRLRQILTNLLSNAFKFTARGRVSVNIYPVGHGFTTGRPIQLRSSDMVAFEVSDTGIGIPPEKREIIFDAFRQADAGTGRKYGGTGLGLAICRKLAEQMGGEIELVSEPGKGSTFTAYLPLRAKKEASARPKGASASARNDIVDEKTSVSDEDFVPIASAATQERKILLVDDDPRNRYSLNAALEAEGYAVITAATGEAALEVLDRQPDIDCVLLDIMMPGMNGYETTRRIRAQPRFARLPVVAVTAKAMAKDLQKCMEAGCSAYLSKPVDITQLREILQTLKRK
jgi:CheY-like chemotaxis protein